MKQEKRPSGLEDDKAGPPSKPADDDRPVEESLKGPDVHSGQGAQSAMERMKRVDRQRARSRGNVERPQA
jgi:hypothetical protein